MTFAQGQSRFILSTPKLLDISKSNFTWIWGMKDFSNDIGHMVKSFKNFLLWNQKAKLMIHR